MYLLHVQLVLTYERSPKQLIVHPVLKRIEHVIGVFTRTKHVFVHPIALKGPVAYVLFGRLVVEHDGPKHHDVSLCLLASGDGAFEKVGQHEVIGVQEVQPLSRGRSKPGVARWAFTPIFL